MTQPQALGQQDAGHIQIEWVGDMAAFLASARAGRLGV